MERRKITWTHDEREAVATEWAKLRLDNPFANPNTLLTKAQGNVLPQHRKRAVTFAIDKSLKSTCSARFKELLKVEPVIIEKPAPPPPPVDVMQVIANMPIVELRMYAERRWMEEILSRLEPASLLPQPLAKSENGNGTHHAEIVSATLPPALSVVQQLAKPTPPSPPDYFQVALVGCAVTRTEQIRSKLPSDTKLILIDKSRGVQPNIFPDKCSEVIVHKASREWYDAAEEKYGRNHVHYVQPLEQIVGKIMQLRSVWIAEKATKKQV